MAETNLAKLLAFMEPKLVAGNYVFCTCPLDELVKIKVNPICTFFYHDHLFVPQSMAEEALEALKALSR